MATGCSGRRIDAGCRGRLGLDGMDWARGRGGFRRGGPGSCRWRVGISGGCGSIIGGSCGGREVRIGIILWIIWSVSGFCRWIRWIELG